MNSNYNRQDILQGLSETLQHMLDLAKKNDWEEVANCNKLRLSLSSQLQAAPSHQAAEEEEKLLVQRLTSLDLEVIGLAKIARDVAADDMHNINGRKSNVNQYLQNQFY